MGLRMSDEVVDFVEKACPPVVYSVYRQVCNAKKPEEAHACVQALTTIGLRFYSAFCRFRKTIMSTYTFYRVYIICLLFCYVSMLNSFWFIYFITAKLQFIFHKFIDYVLK